MLYLDLLKLSCKGGKPAVSFVELVKKLLDHLFLLLQELEKFGLLLIVHLNMICYNLN